MTLLTRITLVGLFAFFTTPALRADEASNKAAEELLLAMKSDKLLSQSIDQILDAQAESNPELARLRPVMKRFFDKHMSWESLKDELIAIYVKEFTVAELREMVKFYKTPVGQKLAEKTPVLTSKGMQLGMARMQANQAELRQMIEAELKK